MSSCWQCSSTSAVGGNWVPVVWFLVLQPWWLFFIFFCLQWLSCFGLFPATVLALVAGRIACCCAVNWAEVLTWLQTVSEHTVWVLLLAEQRRVWERAVRWQQDSGLGTATVQCVTTTAAHQATRWVPGKTALCFQKERFRSVCGFQEVWKYRAKPETLSLEQFPYPLPGFLGTSIWIRSSCSVWWKNCKFQWVCWHCSSALVLWHVRIPLIFPVLSMEHDTVSSASVWIMVFRENLCHGFNRWYLQKG